MLPKWSMTSNWREGRTSPLAMPVMGVCSLSDALMAAASLARSSPNPEVELLPSQSGQVLGSVLELVVESTSAVHKTHSVVGYTASAFQLFQAHICSPVRSAILHLACSCCQLTCTALTNRRAWHHCTHQRASTNSAGQEGYSKFATKQSKKHACNYSKPQQCEQLPEM